MAEFPGFINTEKIISQLEIAPNMTVADLGAGHGFFTVAFAKKVGSSGQVYAVDVLPEALEAIRSRAKLEGLFNIKPVRGNLEKPGGSTLRDESCDMVMVANVLFQVGNKVALINEVKRILKPGGHFVIIEWRPYTGLGPKKEHRLTEEESKQLILSLGFSEPNAVDAGSHHYGFIFKK